jgi:hemerythrin superfamily protein
MATRPTSSAKLAADATLLLEADHKAVKRLFRRYDRTKDAMSRAEKIELVSTICRELSVHAQVEEEILYPAVRRAIDDADLMDEAVVEHASAKQLIAELEAMRPNDPLFDAKVKVLGEYVDHHVKEEEEEMFRKARSRKAGLDLAALGARIAARKAALAEGGSMAPQPGARVATKARTLESGAPAH